MRLVVDDDKTVYCMTNLVKNSMMKEVESYLGRFTNNPLNIISVEPGFKVTKGISTGVRCIVFKVQHKYYIPVTKTRIPFSFANIVTDVIDS